jgi:pyrroline-5-carboxylate reductase
MSLPVDDLFMSNRTSPPAFQKYLACAALGNVTVCVHVMVQAAVPEPVLVVLAVLPVQVELVVPELVAYPLRVVTLVISVATLAKIAITLPVTGAVLEVNVVVV